MQKLLKAFLLASSFILVLLLIPVSTNAITTNSNDLHENQKLMDEGGKVEAATTGGAPLKKATSASELKQAACEVHVKVINLRQNNIVSHTQKIQDRLGKLVVAVEKFYSEKVISQGKSVVNYDALVADTVAKNTALTTALDKIKTDTATLTCEKDQAKTQFTTFKTDMLVLNKAIKDYRLSVLQFMQAVKKAAGSIEGKNASNSAKEVAN